MLSPSLFDNCVEYIMESNLLKESEVGTKTTVRSMNSLSYKRKAHKWLKNTRN